MSVPANTVLVTLQGTPVAPNNKPVTGSVNITLLTSVVTGPNEVVPQVVRAQLFNGTWSTALLTTTDDTTFPNGWTYQVDSWFKGLPYTRAVYYIKDTDAVNGVIDINTLTPITTPDGRSKYATMADFDALLARLFATIPQFTAATTWTLNHNLGYVPSVRVKDSSGNFVTPASQQVDENTAVLTFGTAISGVAYFS